MGVFDLDCGANTANANVSTASNVQGTFNGRTRDECIIALKVYDSCRQQDCLESNVIGPARAARCATYCNITVDEGEIITPPSNAAGVTVDDLKLKNVVIVSKKPNPFRNGFWDIDLKYVFKYRLIFRDVSANELCSVDARSVFNKKVTLFGSLTTNSLISTDLFGCGGSSDLKADPFVLVESKAVALAAELRYNNCCCGEGENAAQEVLVTIGLFTIIKLFRLVNLLVESKGFCIPEECEDLSALSPCEFFDSLDFPLDIFAPPQKAEFFAGISSNIPASSDSDDCVRSNRRNNRGCGCCDNNGNSCNCGCK